MAVLWFPGNPQERTRVSRRGAIDVTAKRLIISESAVRLKALLERHDDGLMRLSDLWHNIPDGSAKQLGLAQIAKVRGQVVEAFALLADIATPVRE